MNSVGEIKRGVQAPPKAGYLFSVAQTSSLLYRGFPTRIRLPGPSAVEVATFCRLEIGDTAGWKPALPWRAAALNTHKAGASPASDSGKNSLTLVDPVLGPATPYIIEALNGR